MSEGSTEDMEPPAILHEAIRRFPFPGMTQDQYSEVLDALSKASGDQHTVDDIKEACEAFAQQMGTDKFLDDSDYGTYAGTQAVDYIKSSAEDSEIPLSEYGPLLYKAYLACFPEAGPTSGQLTVADDIHTKISKYFETMKGEDLISLAKLYKRKFLARQADIDADCVDRFYSQVRGHCSRIIRGSLNDNVDELQPAAKDFLELYVYAQDMLEEIEDSEVNYTYHFTASDIKRRFTDKEGRDDRCHLYDSVTDAEIFRQHIDRAVNLMCCETYPREHQDGLQEEWLNMIQDHMLMFPEKAKEYAQSMVDAPFKLMIYGTPGNFTLARFIVRFFNDADKKASAVFMKDVEINMEHIKKPLSMKQKFKDDSAKAYKQYTDGIVYVYRDLALEITKKKKDKTDMFSVMIAMMHSGVLDQLEAVYRVMRDLTSKDIKWKEEATNITRMLDALYEVAVGSEDDDDFSSENRGSSKLVDILDHLLEMIKKAKLFKETTTAIVKLIIGGLKNPTNDALVHLAEKSAGRLDWKIPPVTNDEIHEVIEALVVILGSEDLIDEENHLLKSMLIESVVGPGKTADVGCEFAGDYTKLNDAVVDKPDMEDMNDTATVYAQAKVQILKFVLSNKEHKECVEPFAESIFKWAEESDWEMLPEVATQMGINALVEHPEVMVPYMDKLLEFMKSRQDTTLIGPLNKINSKKPEMIQAIMPDLLDIALSAETALKASLLGGLISEVVKLQPEAISDDDIRKLLPMFTSPTDSMYVIHLFYSLSKPRPESLLPAVDTLLSAAPAQPNITGVICSILGDVALVNEETSRKCVESMMKMLQTVPTETKPSILGPLKTIGVKYRELLVKHKQTFVELKSEPQVTEVCTSILDVIEGRTLETVQDEVGDQRTEIENVKNDVAEQGENVVVLEGKVKRQAKDMEHVKEDVTKAEKKLEKVEATVKETVARVDKLETMVLVNSPNWSREVASLMNPAGEHDWRLMAQRLGYSNDDVRAWATQPDPCLAVLDEWFARNSTSKATRGIISVLEEINRTDAADIVKNALSSVVDVVEDTESEEELPEVFISYQWGHQPHIKLLKQHLENAGFKSWVDIGQMGGGDKLFEKIDAGIRAAKVVICCVSEKYATSANCTREVNLAVNLWKPIIPLLMEKMSWPPKGAMGPVFGEYLFVRFFQRPAELTNDERFWPVPKMEELLMQLQIYSPPDKTLVEPGTYYENWWAPKEEQIVIPKPAEVSTKPAITAGEKDEEKSPDVFISYQWGKQPQIKVLYKRLTELGYTCWLDINQMGGGDSLYDKIDKGVRNCKVVVSCVTKKYAISANCRREVSLSDALKKPIIPLLLEKMDWPPEGPMSMPLTQLLFINFYRDEENQMVWKGPKFDELLTKLQEYVPGVQPYEVVAEGPDVNKSTEKTEKTEELKQTKSKECVPEDKPSKVVAEESDVNKSTEELKQTKSKECVPEDEPSKVVAEESDVNKPIEKTEQVKQVNNASNASAVQQSECCTVL